MINRDNLISALKRFATLLELDGANSFKVNAYVKGARVLSDEALDLDAHFQSGTLTDIDGVGKGLAEKIEEFARVGHIAELAELEAKFPPGLVAMTDIPGFGAKKARAVFDELGIASIEDLAKGCQDGRVAELKGFGKKTAEKILAGIEQLRKHSGRFRIDVAYRAAQPILQMLRAHPDVKRVEVAGSLRRWRETAKDLDFVCATDKPAEVSKAFLALPNVESVIGSGETKTSVLLSTGMQADLRCVSEEQFPFTLQHFSGSKEHNTALRALAKEKGLKSNEYGLFPEGSEKSLPAADEADIYRHLGLAFIPPELREDMGEIAAAAHDALPTLVEQKDLRGLLHMHTHYSDGYPQVEDYARWAHEHGYEWMGIADHSQSAAYAGGLKPERVRKQWKEIDEVNARWKDKGVVLLKGIESDILSDGALDYEESLLAEFDFIVASVHNRLNLGEEEQTARVLRAVEHPRTTVLGHMTGRLILAREGMQLRQKDIIRRCAECGTIIEINAAPKRLDMDWRLVHFAIEQGALLSIGPDAHDMAMLDNVKYGLAMARKGWAEAQHIVNTWTAKNFLEYARKKK
jgi:DNA polymerase (family 10)